MFENTSITLTLLAIGIATFLAFFCGGGGYVLFLSLSDKRKASFSRKWPSVPGKIVSSQIEEITLQTSDGPRSYLALRVEYEFAVGSRTYIGNKQVPGRIPKSIPYRNEAQVAKRFAVDSVVPVYYNPLNPQESCLEREAPLSNLTLAIAILLLSIGACGVCTFGFLLFNALRTLILDR